MKTTRFYRALPGPALSCALAAALPLAAQAKVDVVTLADQPWYEAADRAVTRQYASPQNSSAKSISIADINEPLGVTIKPHHHDWEEICIVEAGTGLMIVADDTLQVSAGQTIVIPPGAWHNISNNGKEELRLTVVCSPAWHEPGLKFDKPPQK